MQMKIEDIKTRISAVAVRYGNSVVSVYLFGSCAEGRATSLSDLDIAVLLDPGERPFFDLRFALYADFSRALQTNDLDLTILNSLENLIILEKILRDGILLYDGRPDRREEFEVRMLHRALDFKRQRFQVMGV